MPKISLQVVGGWTCHVIGFVGLALLCGCKNSFDNGVDLDGDGENGDGVRPEFSFFAYIFRKKITAEEVSSRLLKHVLVLLSLLGYPSF